jgi:hypothetical protein
LEENKMACLIVPAAEAVVTTIISAAAKGKNAPEKAESPFLKKLNWLNSMLWGGSFLLAFEHVWHGEITPWFPFLTAAGSPEETAVMLHEMATSGVAMAVLVTAVWFGMVVVTNALEKKTEAASA